MASSSTTIFFLLLLGVISVNSITLDVGVEKGDNLYILFLGTSGCGKSSTINFLLDKSVAQTGDSDSTTSAIQEYSVQITNGSNSSNVIFIDTPGFGDTRGLNYDATFLATLQIYLETHYELSRRQPDIVILCNRYDDNRFNGDGAQFVKMLKGINFMKGLWLQSATNKIDGTNSSEANTAILLTHFGNEVSNSASLVKIQQYKNVLEEYTRFSSQLGVLFAENKAHIQEGVSGESESSEEDADYRASQNATQRNFLFPKGNPQISYPANLCNWFKTAVPNPNSKIMIDKLCNLDYISVLPTKRFELININDTKAIEMLQILTKMNLQIVMTPVSIKLASTFAELSAKGDKFGPNTLSYLQKALNIHGVINLEDVPVTNSKTASLLRNLRTDDEIVTLLDFAFGIQPSDLVLTLTGLSYNPVRKQMITLPLFDMSKSELSPIGFKVPQHVVCSTVSEPANGNLRLRHKWLRETHVISGSTSLSLEFQAIHCKMRTENMIEKSVIDNLSSLSKFDLQDYSSMVDSKVLIEKIGCYIITESFLGGLIQVSTSRNDTNFSSGWESYSTEKILNKLQESVEIPEDKKLQIKFFGGDSTYYTSNLALFFNGKLFDSWVRSVIDNPTPLPGFMETKPLANFIQSLNGSAASELTNACNYFHSKPPEFLEKLILSDLKKFDENNAKLSESVLAQVTEINLVMKSLETCQKDKNLTLVQSYEIANKFYNSENALREANLRLTSTNNEKLKLNSENEGNKKSLVLKLGELTKEKEYSKQLNTFLSHCNSRANSLQLSLNTCTTDRDNAHRHRHHHHRH